MNIVYVPGVPEKVLMFRNSLKVKGLANLEITFRQVDEGTNYVTNLQELTF